jgi:hypothetical protein
VDLFELHVAAILNGKSSINGAKAIYKTIFVYAIHSTVPRSLGLFSEETLQVFKM